jgi:hypothetical protein
MPKSKTSRNAQDLHPACNRVVKQRRKIAALLSIVCVAGMCGCSTSASLRSLSSTGTWNDTVETLRNRSFSAKAYYRRQHNFGNQGNSKDFQAGFRAGYEAIADGKPGCPPAFPPREYWSWEFQNAEGQSRTAAWFAGYPHGVQAAREEGVNQWARLQGSSKCADGCGSTAPGGCNQCGTPTDYSMGSTTPTNINFGDQGNFQTTVVESENSIPPEMHNLQSVPGSQGYPVSIQDFNTPSNGTN